MLGPTRVMDHLRLVLSGTAPIDVVFNIRELFTLRSPPDWRCSYNIWPRDIGIRRNMATSDWADIRDLVAQHDANLVEQDGAEVDVAAFQGLFAGTSSSAGTSASIRWAVTAGLDEKLLLSSRCIRLFEKHKRSHGH